MEKMIEPSIENLDLLNDLGFTYKEIGNCFEPYLNVDRVKYLFRKYGLKKKSKMDIIKEYLDIHPFARSKDVAKELDVSIRLVDLTKQNLIKKTRIEIQFNKNSFSCVISGHSNYAERGRDIVCSAVSTLSFYIINTLSQCGIATHEVVKDGFLSFKCEIQDDTIFIMLDSYVRHLKEIASQYPNNVQVYGC